MASIKKLFAFDFDDTIATTSNSIGVQRQNADGSVDESFEDWLYDNAIDYSDISGKPDNPFYWMDSGAFAEFENKKQKDLEYIRANEFEDVYDFSQTASIDVESASPIGQIINLMQQAHTDSQSKVVIITARAGTGSAYSPAFNNSARTTNRDDIKNFLSGQGVEINANHISTTGDSGGNPADKANALMNYINQYNPEEVYFYDDNRLNLEAILSLCEKVYPEININAFLIDKAGNISSAGECS